jgi:hypothetical protein
VYEHGVGARIVAAQGWRTPFCTAAPATECSVDELAEVPSPSYVAQVLWASGQPDNGTGSRSIGWVRNSEQRQLTSSCRRAPDTVLLRLSQYLYRIQSIASILHTQSSLGAVSLAASRGMFDVSPGWPAACATLVGHVTNDTRQSQLRPSHQSAAPKILIIPTTLPGVRAAQPRVFSC